MPTERKKDQVVITAKRLDAEEREQCSVEVDVPSGEAGQRAQLIELVRARYPHAEFRSFADDAASFLAYKLLVVAVYKRAVVQPPESDPMPDEGPPPQLFAA